MSVTTPLGKFTSWETEEGEILKTDLALGMEMYREPKTTAMNMRSSLPKFVVTSAASEDRPTAYVPPSDFAIGTAIAIDTPITKPREVRSLSLVVSGIDNKDLVISDRRQRFTPVERQPDAYRLQVAVERFEPSQSLKLPLTKRTITLQKDTAVRIHLNTVPYLEYEHPQIMAAAKKIRGNEKNAYLVASRIRKWVYENMKPDYTIGVPRSCVDIFKQRRGVCRDYATLFAALARAAGIPTRTVGGILYAEGRFFYHAWVECWVGEWVPFDATLNTDFVDATHIKFSQGDVIDMYNITGLVGRLKIRVESAE
jgi:transglutaminase-like putative cysteine protease